MEKSKEITIKELLKGATPETLELLLKRAKLPNEKVAEKFEAFLQYAQNDYVSRINAEDLLSLEKGLLQNLKSVQESLSCKWSKNSKKTVREVLQDESNSKVR